MLVFDNVHDGETVHQRCLLLIGRYDPAPEDGHVRVCVAEKSSGTSAFEPTTWPACEGHFRALVILSPGLNTISVTAPTPPSASSPNLPPHSTSITVQYTPLLHLPPLHLAILVARDSPLLVDCPPARHAGISSAHATLDAAVAKLRMTAYMWQAATAEDMRRKGLGRRSFRLEEEWAPETLSQHCISATVSGAGSSAAAAAAAAATTTTPASVYPAAGGMQTTAKIHIIRTEKTVAELRDPDIAQQNPQGRNRDELHAIFSRALRAHGSPFLPAARPVVAGLILDSHFDIDRDMIVGHAALGSHCSTAGGISLGIFGSHLTYAWPRFLEEVPASLTDLTIPGASVGNDCGECTSMWEACAVGQGAFLHEVGHAFSAPHSSGIMLRGYSPDWARWFVSATAYCAHKNQEPTRPVTSETKNACTWDVRDALAFANLPHFRMPEDPSPAVRAEFAGVAPTCVLGEGDDEEEEVVVVVADGEKMQVHEGTGTGTDTDAGTDVDAAGADAAGTRTRPCVKIASSAGISHVWLNGTLEPVASIPQPAPRVLYTRSGLEERFDEAEPLALEVLGMNGLVLKVPDLWKVFDAPLSLLVPGTNIRLHMTSVTGDETEGDRDDFWHWAVMLQRRSQNHSGGGGGLVRARKIDLRVGAALDGAVVYYADGSQIPCGPRATGRGMEDLHMGGHQSRKMALPAGVEVTRVAVTKSRGGDLCGLRMWLSNGKARGALNKRYAGEGMKVCKLEPVPGHRIIGFYGYSGQFGMAHRFGIVTAPRDVELPASMYDMPELQNTTGLDPAKNRRGEGEHGAEMDDDDEISEDSDDGYDSMDNECED